VCGDISGDQAECSRVNIRQRCCVEELKLEREGSMFENIFSNLFEFVKKYVVHELRNVKD